MLVLDEPTAALSSEEVDRLFSFVRRLRDHRVALVYITHRLDEVAASPTTSWCCATGRWRAPGRPDSSIGAVW